MSPQNYRFEIAFSFAGDEARDQVREVATLLKDRLGDGKVFFDEWFLAELAGMDAHLVLQNFYRNKTRLVVACLGLRYNEESWPQEEWRAIQAMERDLRDAATDNVKRLRFLPLRFGDGEVDGILPTALVPDVRNSSAQEIADLIIERLQKAKRGQIEKSAARKPAMSSAEKISPEDILALEDKVRRIHIDRDEEKKLFSDMVTKRSPKRALLIEAESGMGKSHLIEEFLQTAVPFLHARVDFKNASLTFGDVLFSIRKQLGPENFQNFDMMCRDMLTRTNAPQLPTLFPSQLDGLLLSAQSDKVLSQQRRQAFDALLSDLIGLSKATGQPVVLIIDTFERASSTLKKWISSDLVPRISEVDDVIWVIAGQETPSVELSDANWLAEQRLQPLAVEHRIDYLRQIKLEWEDVLIKYITVASEGKPKKLQDLAIVAATMNS